MNTDQIKSVLDSFTKRQRIAFRQEFGSMPIQEIRHDKNDDYVMVQFGADRGVVQHSFFLRKTGRVAHMVTTPVYQDWHGKWKKSA